MRKFFVIGVAGILILLAVGILMYTARESGKEAEAPAGGESSIETSRSESTSPAPAPATSGGSGVKTAPSGTEALPQKDQGRVIIVLKDEFVSIDQVESIFFSIKEMQVQSPAKGWTTVMTGPRVYDLVKIYKMGTKEFLAEAYLDPGTYNQLRMVVDSVRVVKKGSDTPEEAKLPSNELRFPARALVAKGENTSVEIDVLSEKSLHTTTGGSYVFLPVVRVETKSNVTSFQVRQNMVTIIGGAGFYDAMFGMDENGNVKDGYRLSPGAKLEIVDDKIKIVPQ